LRVELRFGETLLSGVWAAGRGRAGASTVSGRRGARGARGTVPVDDLAVAVGLAGRGTSAPSSGVRDPHREAELLELARAGSSRPSTVGLQVIFATSSVMSPSSLGTGVASLRIETLAVQPHTRLVEAE
jgi:hypothetical protein